MKDVALIDYVFFNSSLGLIALHKASLVSQIVTITINGTSAAESGVIISIGAGASCKYAIKRQAD